MKQWFCSLELLAVWSSKHLNVYHKQTARQRSDQSDQILARWVVFKRA